MRRKKGALVPLEISILAACINLALSGLKESHGFLIAKQIGDQQGARMLTSHGTLYKALGRMAKAGLLESRWEDPVIAAEQSRPRRRFYRVTAEGQTAFRVATAPTPRPTGASVTALV
jgi:PadR family transcriptional regulator PadR